MILKMSNKRPNRTSVDRICVNCKRQFRAPLKEVRIGKGRCCSLSCAAALASLNRNQKGSANNNWRGGSNNADRKRRYREKNPLKHQAHLALTKAIRRGILKREPCIKCGNLKVEGHHEDYSQPLVVTWLCKKHLLGAHKGKFGDLKEKTMATGEALAKGGIKAQFPPAGGQISQERWDAIWSETLEEFGERVQKNLEIKKEE